MDGCSYEVCYRSGSLWIAVDLSECDPAPFRSVVLRFTSDPPGHGPAAEANEVDRCGPHPTLSSIICAIWMGNLGVLWIDLDEYASYAPFMQSDRADLPKK